MYYVKQIYPPLNEKRLTLATQWVTISWVTHIYIIKRLIFYEKWLTFICSMFYPQTFNLFELLWQSEGLNPKPVELNLVLFILAKISCKTNVPSFVPSFVPYRAHILLCPPLYSKCAPSLFYVFIDPEKGGVLFFLELFKLYTKYYLHNFTYQHIIIYIYKV